MIAININTKRITFAEGQLTDLEKYQLCKLMWVNWMMLPDFPYHLSGWNLLPDFPYLPSGNLPYVDTFAVPIRGWDAPLLRLS